MVWNNRTIPMFLLLFLLADRQLHMEAIQLLYSRADPTFFDDES